MKSVKRFVVALMALVFLGACEKDDSSIEAGQRQGGWFCTVLYPEAYLISGEWEWSSYDQGWNNGSSKVWDFDGEQTFKSKYSHQYSDVIEHDEDPCNPSIAKYFIKGDYRIKGDSLILEGYYMDENYEEIRPKGCEGDSVYREAFLYEIMRDSLRLNDIVARRK